MKYTWIDYNLAYKEMVDSWLDEDAKRFTGCDEGFDEYYQYWANDPETKIGENFWAKIIIENGIPVGIIVIGLREGVFTISEFIICPNKRGKGTGTSVLLELLVHAKKVLGIEIEKAQAVIFPNNIVSQKAFEKAGFTFYYEHPDGDAWYYRYHFSETCDT